MFYWSWNGGTVTRNESTFFAEHSPCPQIAWNYESVLSKGHATRLLSALTSAPFPSKLTLNMSFIHIILISSSKVSHADYVPTRLPPDIPWLIMTWDDPFSTLLTFGESSNRSSAALTLKLSRLTAESYTQNVQFRTCLTHIIWLTSQKS